MEEKDQVALPALPVYIERHKRRHITCKAEASRGKAQAR